MINSLKCLIHFVILFPLLAYSQGVIEVKGRVLDDTTNEPLSFASIGVANSSIGTIANADGEFILNIPYQEVGQISASYLGYSSQTLDIDTYANPLEIRLKQASIELPELLVSGKQKSLLEEAINAIPTNHDQGKMKLTGFWRAQMKDRNDFIQLSETAFDIYRFGEIGKEKEALNITRSRIARDSAVFNKFSNFQAGMSPKGFFKNSFLIDHSFLSRKTLKSHEFELTGLSTINDRTVYVLDFDKKPSKDVGYQGQVFLDTETLAFVRISYWFSPSNKEKLKLFEDAKFAGMITGLGDSTFDKYYTELNYQYVNGKWYLSFAKYDVLWTLVKDRKDVKFNEPITYKADFVVTDLAKKNYTLPSSDQFAKNKILTNQSIKNKGDFWKGLNYLIADEDIEAIFDRIEKKNRNYKK